MWRKGQLILVVVGAVTADVVLASRVLLLGLEVYFMVVEVATL